MPDLLSALDPEQREVAEALRGPVRVLAGAGTGKTRAITHRIAHGVASNVYAPHEVLAVTFTTRAAGEMRTRLRALGAGGVQARTFHSAALRQLRYFWPHVHGTELPQIIESKIGLLATATRNQRLRADQALLRDLASEIEWAKVSNIGAEQYAAAAEARNRSVTGQTPEAVARIFDGYEAVKREQGRMDMEDVLLLTAGHPRRGRAGRRAGAPPVQVVRRRRVPGRLAAPVRAARPVARRPRRDLRGRRPRPDDLLLRRRQRRLPARLPREVRRDDLDRAGPQLPLHRRRSSRPPTGCSPAPPSQGVALRAQQPAGPAVEYAQRTDEVAEAEAVATRIAKLRNEGRALGEVAVLFRINAQSETFEEALAGRGIPYVIRGASRFFDRPEVREAVTRIRGAARSGQDSEQGDGASDTVRGTLAGMGWTEEPPAGPRPDPRPLGVLAGAGRPGRRSSTGTLDDVRRRPRPPRRRAARPGRRGRHARDVPRRQGPRVGLRVPLRPPGRHAADHLRRDARPRSRRSAACCTSA